MPHFKATNIKKTSSYLATSHRLTTLLATEESGSSSLKTTCRETTDAWRFQWKYTSVKCQLCCSPSSTAQLLAVDDRPLGSGCGLKVKLSLVQTPQLQVLVLEVRRLELLWHSLFSILISTVWMDICKHKHVDGLWNHYLGLKTTFCCNGFLCLWKLWECSKEHFSIWV